VAKLWHRFSRKRKWATITSGDKMKRTVYLADDEENIRNLMQLFLTNGGYEVSTFSNGDDLLKEFLEKPSDLVILDVMMPGTDGLSLCTRIRQSSNAFIIIVSARDSELDRIAGITLGSDDYLTKPFSPMELIARANALFRRAELSRSGSPEQLSLGNFQLDCLNRIVKADGRVLVLTPTEYELMVYFLKNSDRAVSREELLKNIWNFDFDADTRAADDVIKRLRRKLETAGANIRIESVWGFGFRLAEEAGHEDS
jgi:DNA-binding response OmpR family regulator